MTREIFIQQWRRKRTGTLCRDYVLYRTLIEMYAESKIGRTPEAIAALEAKIEAIQVILAKRKVCA